MLTKEQRAKVAEVAKQVKGSDGDGHIFYAMFDHPKEGKVFGRVDSYSDDAYAQALEGRIIVTHEVYPNRGPYAVSAKKLTAIKYGFSDRPGENTLAAQCGFFSWGTSPCEDYTSLEQLAHEIRAEKNSGEGVQANDMFYIGVGEGHAIYVVTRVSGNRCDVEWRGFQGDHYRDHHFMLGRKGTPLADVERYVDMNRASKRLFPGKGPKVNKEEAFPKLMKEYEKNHGFPAPVTL